MVFEDARYPPHESFCLLNGVGSMTAEQRAIIPKLVAVAEMQK
jgi:hypothetical protein